jgi:hypothetical protein
VLAGWSDNPNGVLGQPFRQAGRVSKLTRRQSALPDKPLPKASAPRHSDPEHGKARAAIGDT